MKFLARQSLPLRGSWDQSANAESNSNFHQLMVLRAEEDPAVLDWLLKKNYMSPQIQNEMIEVLALERYLKTYRMLSCIP